MIHASHLARPVLLAALTLGAPALALAQAATDKPGDQGTAYQDWRHRCEIQEQTGQEVCFIAQRLVATESDRPVLQVVVGFPANRDTPVALLTAPLGVSLPAGITIKIDDGQPRAVPFERCIPSGCQAIWPLDDALLRSLKRGLKAEMTFRDPARRPVPVPVSLKGFTAAFDALGNRGAREGPELRREPETGAPAPGARGDGAR